MSKSLQIARRWLPKCGLAPTWEIIQADNAGEAPFEGRTGDEVRDTLQRRSIPSWENFNVDYNEIEYLIKARISKGQAQPTAVQGKDNEARASQKFEDKLYAELCDQHQRIDLFVQSKARETSRRSRRGFRIVLLRQVLTGRFISASGQADRSAREASRVLESYQNHSEAAREVFQRLKRHR